MPLSRAQVIELANAEAEAAFREGWRHPVKGNVAQSKIQGQRATLGRRNMQEVTVIFEALRVRQEKLIIAAGKEMWREGTTPTIAGLASKLGIDPQVLYRGSNETGRFKYAVTKALGKLSETGRLVKEPLKLVEEIQRNCRCGCADRTDGQSLIQGYLPECWEEYQQWVAKDERLSA